MSVCSRLASLEKRHGAAGDECRCTPDYQIVWCRDPSVPPPPQARCDRCGRPRSRVLVRVMPCEHAKPPPPGAPAYELVNDLLDWYVKSSAEAYP